MKKLIALQIPLTEEPKTTVYRKLYLAMRSYAIITPVEYQLISKASEATVMNTFKKVMNTHGTLGKRDGMIVYKLFIPRTIA